MYKSMGDSSGLCNVFTDDRELRHAAATGATSPADDLFSILQTWEECMNGEGRAAVAPGAAPAPAHFSPNYSGIVGGAAGAKPTPAGGVRRRQRDDEEKGGDHRAPLRKKHKLGSTSSSAAAAAVAAAADVDEGAVKMSHITVERNRRKQMNENLAVLRTLMPCFYVKRGDQASIVGGVVDYIKELQQVLHSLEAKKHRKVYAEQVLSPRPALTASPVSTRQRPPPLTLSPRPLIIKSVPAAPSPRLAVPISPRTPTPGSPYKPSAAARLPHPAAAAYIPAAPVMTQTASASSPRYMHDLSPRPYLPTLDSIVTELAAHAARTFVAGGASSHLLVPDVKVEFAGPNLVLKTTSHRAPAQALKIITALESLSLEILHITISTVGDTTVHSFTIKIGIECELSAEELVNEIRKTFL